jgi:uncharacterized protein YlxP (DUF503 family)
MFVAVIRVELHLPYAASLKDKRQVLNRIKDRMRNAHAAVAEIDHADLWQRAALGVAVVTGSAAGLTTTLDDLRAIVARQDQVAILDWTVRHYE